MPDGKQTLYLHAGTHKTGSTSFQRSLRANAAKLTERGFFPFGLPVAKGRRSAGRKKYNLGKLTNTFLRPGIASISRVAQGRFPDPAVMERDRASYLNDLKALRNPNLILSSEALTFLRTPAEKEAMRVFLESIGREVKIVLVRRDEASWRASWENQLRKFPKVWQCNLSLPDEQRANGEWYYDWPSILGFWSDLGDVSVVNYNEERARDGNVIPAIYRAMGIDVDGLDTRFERNRRVKIDD
jgi:hypothetical protein